MMHEVSSRLRGAARILLSRKPVASRIGENRLSDPTIMKLKELSLGSGLRVNLGCGTDYRSGWLNIDGSASLPKVDKVLRLPNEPLDEALGSGVADYILANDVVEHVRHWEGVNFLGQIYRTLKPGGGVEIRVPDCEYILANNFWSTEQKLVLLFGGQDIPQGRDAKMDGSRAIHPEFFCHAFGWTMRRMKQDMLETGFRQCAFRRSDSNFVAYAIKPE
jgi:hypothetical protein